MDEDGTFEHIVPIGLGDIAPGPTLESRVFRGEAYTQREPVFAQVEHVVGEFYWRVEAGEAVEILEFAGPKKQKIGEERSGQEIAVSFSRPIEWSELERAFGVVAGRKGPAANADAFWMVLAAAWLLISAVYVVQAKNAVVFENDIPLGTIAADASTSDLSHFSEPFRVEHGEKNLKITLQAAVENTWLSGEVALVNADTGHVWEDDFQLSHYSGVEDGEAWSEGSRVSTLWFSRMPAGSYTLRIDPSWDKVYAAPQLHVEIRNDAPPWGYVFGAMLAIVAGFVIAKVLAYRSQRSR